jgi:hypothetical protein
VRARDAAGNQSVDSNTAVVDDALGRRAVQDDFESGSLSMWSTVAGLSVSQGVTGRRRPVGRARDGERRRVDVRVQDDLADRDRHVRAVPVRGAEPHRRGRPDAFPEQLRRQQALAARERGTGKLSTRNAAGTTTVGNTVINTNQWYTVEIHGKIGAPSTTEVWLDGTLLPELGATGDLGTTNFGQFLLGQTGTTGTYDVVFDDVTVSKNPI